MGYQRFAPPSGLAEFVETVWFYEAGASAAGRERTLPTGQMGIIVGLHDETIQLPDRDDPGRYQRFPGAIVLGAASRYGVIERGVRSQVVGVQFRPGGGFPFFGYPAGDFQDGTVALDDAWGAGARELRERLLTAPDDRTRYRIFVEALLDQVRRPLERHPSVSHALAELRRVPARASVHRMTSEVGLSPKRFIQLFRDEVGLPPKLFGRVRRFQSVVNRVFGRADVDWVDEALLSGYFDQSHFAHDFREFTGLTPGAYLARPGEFVNHVPLED
jgi:AraC-like DNA-binding protein